MVAEAGVRIRVAGREDAGTLTELGARTFRDSFAADNRPEDMEPFWERRWGSR
jgi:hypothetical protein